MRSSLQTRIGLGLVIAVIALCIGAIYFYDRIIGNTPITFYGKVIDQTGRPIQGVDVKADIAVARLVDLIPSPRRPGLSRITVHSHTDPSGMFQVRGVNGIRISGLQLYRDGVEQDRISWQVPGDLLFGPWWTDRGRYRPDASAPVVFRIWENDIEPRIVKWSSGCAATERHDIDFLNPESSGGSVRRGDLVIRYRMHDRDIPSGFIRLIIEARDKGGLQETNDVSVATVPDTGYVSSFQYVVDTNGFIDNQRTVLSKRFFVFARNGQIYGTFEINMKGVPNLPVYYHYVVNTHGGRDISE